MEDIRKKIESGELTAQKARKLIQKAIDDELRKPDEAVDTAFIDACESLLSAMGQTKDSHYADNLRAIRGKIKRKPFICKRAVAAVMLAAAVLVPVGVVNGLKGNDHTSRLQEMQENARESEILTDAERIPLEKETLTLQQAEERQIESGGLRLAAQTCADVDDMGEIYMMLVLLENTTDGEITIAQSCFAGVDAEGKRLDISYAIPENIVVPAGEKAVLSVQIEPNAMADAEHFELLMNTQKTDSAVVQETEADLRDHYFVATLTEDDTDGREANGSLSVWAFDENGVLLDGFRASLGEGEQLLAGESWIFEKRIGSWVTLEQEENAEVQAAGYRLK